ncbi:unknown [Salmonella phage FelixO1]|uniref:Uncharacterized protein n=1 Tax=Salmonella phage Felix O1 (isolate Felix O1-VT1) TaxID=1283336 RepID=Q6KGM0_BPFO1|nr:unknown [Salmonella phage FelixO1]
MAATMRLELTSSPVTGEYFLQLNYIAFIGVPCRSRTYRVSMTRDLQSPPLPSTG